MKISVLNWCYSRKRFLEQTLPGWLNQAGDYEIILGHGPKVEPPVHALVRPVLTPNRKMGEAYNAMLAAASGELILTTQCDMLVRSSDQIARMAARWHPGAIVTDLFYRQDVEGGDWYPQPGTYLQMALIAKADLLAVGAWWPGWDDPGVAAHEDSDLIFRLLERGLVYEFIESPMDIGVLHLWHPRPNYQDRWLRKGVLNPVYPRQAAGQRLFWQRHDKDTVNRLMAEQSARHVDQRRRGVT